MTDISELGLGCYFPHHIVQYGLGATSTLDADDEGVFCVTRVPKSGTLSYVTFVTGTITVGGTLDITVETVDATTGFPTGTLAYLSASGTVVVADGDDNVMKHCQINGATGVEVTKGDLVAICIRCRADGFNGTMPYTMNTATAGFPYAVYYAAAAYTMRSYIPLCSLVIEDAYVTPVGCYPPFIATPIAWGSEHNPDRRGGVLITPVQRELIGVAMYMEPDADCTVYLVDPDGSTIIDTWSVDKDIRGNTGSALFCFILSTPKACTANAKYRVIVLPGSGTHISLYQYVTTLNGALNPFHGDSIGNNCYYTYVNGAPANNFTDDETIRIHMFGVWDKITYPAGGGLIFL